MDNEGDEKESFSGSNKKYFLNRFCVFVGVFPFLLSLLLAMASRKPFLILLPIFGLLPIGENGSHALNAADIIFVCMVGAACIAFAIYGYFVKPFGIIFAAVIWLSVILFILKANQALSDLH